MPIGRNIAPPASPAIMGTIWNRFLQEAEDWAAANQGTSDPRRARLLSRFTDQPKEHPMVDPSAKQLSIVVADRGHVWVGEVTERSADWVKISGARVIRRWGTTDGLNQLANDGPRRDTKLDAPADLEVRTGAVIAIIPCEAEKWAA